jgi:hypothetical protein
MTYSLLEARFHSQIHVQGIDTSPASRKSAEPEPRDRSPVSPADWPGWLGSYRHYAEISGKQLIPET